MKKKSAYVFVSILLFSYSVLGQINTNKASAPENFQTTHFKDTVIQFVNDTKSDEIIINIQKQTQVLELTVTGAITTGKLKVAIVAPKGTTLGEFEITAKNNDKKETSFGEINKSLKEPEAGDWRVKISTVKVSGNIKIKANFENDYYINVPGKFTPDGDGKNDIFKIETYNISEIMSFDIYNKWGELVFSSKKIDEGWDGKVKNELQKPDAYVYRIKAKTVSGHDVSKIGDVFLENKSLKK